MKPIIKKTLYILADILLVAYVSAVIYVAANPSVASAMPNSSVGPSNCQRALIEFEDLRPTGSFPDVSALRFILSENGLWPLGLPMDKVNCRAMEECLESSAFIVSAQCYKTLGGYVHISVERRLPVMLVKPAFGDDYYVDGSGLILKGSGRASNLPIATGYISEQYASDYLGNIGSIIIGDEFWLNQVEQIEVDSCGNLDLIPRVGPHLVHLGSPTDIEAKLNRLRKFYENGLSFIGWHKYSEISVAYGNQIVCKKAKKQNNL